MRRLFKILKFLLSINWAKTLYFNFKMLPFAQAKKLPIVFYGKVKFSSLEGNIIINAPIKFKMIGFGQKYELMSVSKKNAELYLSGTVVFKGHVQFGIDYFLYVKKNALLEMGHVTSLGGNGKIICLDKIIIGDYVRIGYESQVIDTSFHKMIDLTSGNIPSTTSPIKLGNYNYIGGRTTIMKSVMTPNNCTIASNSLLTKDYSKLGECVFIGGIPAKLIKQNIRRAWEEEDLEGHLGVR